MKHTLFALFSGLLLFSASGFCGEKHPVAVPPSTLMADFIMSRSISALKIDLKSEGRLMLGGKGLLRWETLSPAKSTLIIHADQGWIQYPDLDIIKGFDLSTDPAMRIMSEHLSMLTSGRFDDAGALYEVSPEKDGRRVLVPKSAEIKKLFKEMQVTMDTSGAVSAVTLVSANGDITTIVFQNILPNPKLSNELFAAPKAR